MPPDIREFVVVAAHILRTGSCPVRIYALGTGNEAAFLCDADEFVDVLTGRRARLQDTSLFVQGLVKPIVFSLDDDVCFSGAILDNGEHFSGRNGGGVTVTIYERDNTYHQFSVELKQKQT